VPLLPPHPQFLEVITRCYFKFPGSVPSLFVNSSDNIRWAQLLTSLLFCPTPRHFLGFQFFFSLYRVPFPRVGASGGISLVGLSLLDVDQICTSVPNDPVSTSFRLFLSPLRVASYGGCPVFLYFLFFPTFFLSFFLRSHSPPAIALDFFSHAPLPCHLFWPTLSLRNQHASFLFGLDFLRKAFLALARLLPLIPY